MAGSFWTRSLLMTRRLSSAVSRSSASLSSPTAYSSLPTVSDFPLHRLRPLISVAAPNLRNISPSITTIRGFSTRLTSSSLNDPNPNWSNRPPKETILLDGCDFEHWLVVVEKPDENMTRDEIIDSYIKTLAKVVGSEEETRMKIYSVSTRHYFAFGALVSEELSYKLKELPNVRWVLPDSYLDVKNKDYGGEPFINGQAVPYDPKYHEEWVRNNARANERNRRNRDSPRNTERRNMARRTPNMMHNREAPSAGPGMSNNMSSDMPPSNMGGGPPNDMGGPQNMRGFSHLNSISPRRSESQHSNAGEMQNFGGVADNIGGMQHDRMAGSPNMGGMQHNRMAGSPSMGSMQPNNLGGAPQMNMGGMPPNTMAGMPPNTMGGAPQRNMGGMPPNSTAGMPTNTMGGMPPNNRGGMLPNNTGPMPHNMPNVQSGNMPNNAGGMPFQSNPGRNMDYQNNYSSNMTGPNGNYENTYSSNSTRQNWNVNPHSSNMTDGYPKQSQNMAERDTPGSPNYQ